MTVSPQNTVCITLKIRISTNASLAFLPKETQKASHWEISITLDTSKQRLLNTKLIPLINFLYLLFKNYFYKITQFEKKEICINLFTKWFQKEILLNKLQILLENSKLCDSDKNVWQINLIHGKNRMILYMNGMSNSQAAKHWLFLPRNENERIYASLADTSSTATKAIVFYKSHFWNPT